MVQIFRVALVALLFHLSLAASPLPKLQIEAPPELAPVKARLEALDTRRFADIADALAGAAAAKQKQEQNKCGVGCAASGK